MNSVKIISRMVVMLFSLCTTLPGQEFTRQIESPLANDNASSWGGSWGDYNSDGYLDLFVVNDGANLLYKNDNGMAFTQITDGLIVNEHDVNSRSSSWGDYDNDGDLDLIVASFGGYSFFVNNGDGSFTKANEKDVFKDSGASASCSWGNFDGDSFLDLFIGNTNSQNDYLFSNNGDGTFIRINEGDIVNDKLHSRCSNWIDYDNDGDLDLFVATNGNNLLYRYDSPGILTRILDGVLVNDGGNSNSSSWGDFDNDGDFDLFIANAFGENNSLYRNRGDGTFRKVVDGDIVQDGSHSSGSCWGDVDNDGDLDLFVTNFDDQNNSLYFNNGDLTFTRAISGSIVSDGGNSAGCSFADYDNDGDLDLFVANRNGQNNFLYSNNGNDNNWINIECFGSVSNISAIGAKVSIKATLSGTKTWQTRQISSQTGHDSQNSLNVEFGLGDAEIIDSLKVEWPSGIISTLQNIAVNQFITILEEDGITTVDTDNDNLPKEFRLEQNYPNPYNPLTNITYTISKAGIVHLVVYDVLGKRIETLVNKAQQPGVYTVTFDAKDLSSGNYFYRLEIGNRLIETRTMTLVK